MNFTKTMSIILAIVVTGIAAGLSINEKDKPVVAMSRENYEIQTHTIDSLQKTVDSLEVQLESQAQRFDNKEKEYRETIFEYEYGIDWLEKNQPKAYDDFHRILAYKEEYSRVDELENKKRLKKYEYNR
jgi:hypothetical protein